jgi:hypothetical protein
MKIKRGYYNLILSLLNTIWAVNFVLGCLILSFFMNYFSTANRESMILLGGFVFGVFFATSGFMFGSGLYYWNKTWAYWKTEKVMVDKPLMTKWFKTPILTMRFRE